MSTPTRPAPSPPSPPSAPRRCSRFAAAVAILLAAFAPSLTSAQPAAPTYSQPPAVPATPAVDAAPLPIDPTDALFNPAVTSPILKLDIQVSKEDYQKLRDDPRTYVPCIIVDNGQESIHGGVKLKGAAGSFRGVDDRPALTISVGKFKGENETSGSDGQPRSRQFHGLERFHLNNSVQDESLLHEWVCAEVFRAAGYPAARVTHARVSINGRDLGMYVLKEGFDKAFLKRHFGAAAKDAALYDSGFLQDIDADLERDAGKGKDDKADLKRILAACRESDPEKRRTDLDRLLDMEAFLRFIAIERILVHWDGYTNNRNNYRLYIPASPGKARLIPHGMDQVFGEAAFPLDGDAVGLLAVTVLRNPEWRAAYRAELARQVAAFDASALIRRITPVESRLQLAIRQFDGEKARQQSQLARDLNRRLRIRGKNIREQIARPTAPLPAEPAPLKFVSNEARLPDNWTEVAETEGAVHEDVSIDNTGWKRLACPTPAQPAPAAQAQPPSRTVASWRSTVILRPGRYTLSAEANTEGVLPIPGESWPGTGAGVRISGGTRPTGLTDSAHGTAEFTFDIQAQREVVIVLELRAAAGSVAFKTDSVKLTRTGDAATPLTPP